MVELFKYGKNNKRYWDGPKLYKQVVNKALSIAKMLYPGYLFLFLFDNVTNHSVYIDNALCTRKISKKNDEKQVWLYNRWFEKDGTCIK